MKKFFITLGLAVTINLIVLSLIVPVNSSLAYLSNHNATLIADGTGLPPTPPAPPPPKVS